MTDKSIEVPVKAKEAVIDEELSNTLAEIEADDAMDAELEVLTRLGQRVRLLRKQRDLTIKELADHTHLSPRFITQLEAGKGNIAVSRLASIAQALQIGLAELLTNVGTNGDRATQLRAEIDGMLAGRSEAELETARRILELSLGHEQRDNIGLLGLRGAGKTTIGKQLAQSLKMPFWELDERIEDLAGLSLSEIFALHDENYYRRLEGQALTSLLAQSKPSVIALPGGIVNNVDAFAFLKRHSITVWLRAQPDDHMQRVMDQGDRRPMANRPNAMAELRAILKAREPLYEQADIIIDTSQTDIVGTTEAVTTMLRRQGWQL